MLANLDIVLQDSEIQSLLKQGFQPASSYYDPDGDSVEFLAENVAYHAQRIDQTVTVFVSNDDQRLVGYHLSNVSRLARNANDQR